MIGIFDSGVGGLNAYYELKRLLPDEDFIYLSDRKNAPYGTKSEDEITLLTKKDIQRLAEMGADKILIACCTASSIHHRLGEWEREIALPIISAAATIAAELRVVSVIATTHTVRSLAFTRSIRGINPDCTVLERGEQELVRLIEGGARDNHMTPECEAAVDSVVRWVKESSAEALILGCTHFSHLCETFSKRLPSVKIISPAKEGAREIAKLRGTKVGRGRITYTDATGIGQKHRL